jgi:hypothetical protein
MSNSIPLMASNMRAVLSSWWLVAIYRVSLRTAQAEIMTYNPSISKPCFEVFAMETVMHKHPTHLSTFHANTMGPGKSRCSVFSRYIAGSIFIVILGFGMTTSPAPAQENGFVQGKIILAASKKKSQGTAGTTATNTCGNGKIDAGESCDGPDVGGKTCVDFGKNAGYLACTSNCTFDTSGCQ